MDLVRGVLLIHLVVGLYPVTAFFAAPRGTVAGRSSRGYEHGLGRQTASVIRWGQQGATEGGVELSANMKAMQKFAEKYCDLTDTFFCSDLEITATVIKGLAKHKDEYGAPLCPCRHYEDKAAEVSLAYWNCPCVPMRERKECHCMLFLTKDNPFVGDQRRIEEERLQEPLPQATI